MNKYPDKVNFIENNIVDMATKVLFLQDPIGLITRNKIVHFYTVSL